jgi:hypothetical protein
MLDSRRRCLDHPLVGVGGPVAAVTSSPTWTGAESVASLSSAFGCRATTHAVLTARRGRRPPCPPPTRCITCRQRAADGALISDAQAHPLEARPGAYCPPPSRCRLWRATSSWPRIYTQMCRRRTPKRPPRTLLPTIDSLRTLTGNTQLTAFISASLRWG